jgi:hypothetical protein
MRVPRSCPEGRATISDQEILEELRWLYRRLSALNRSILALERYEAHLAMRRWLVQSGDAAGQPGFVPRICRLRQR